MKKNWVEVSVEEFTGLTTEEVDFIDLKIDLSELVRSLRKARGWSQAQLAERIGSSQSRVALMEKTDESVGFDLLVRTVLALGATREQIAQAIGQYPPVDAVAPSAKPGRPRTTKPVRSNTAKPLKKVRAVA